MKEQNNNYSVYEHITPDGMYYFGVTTDIEKRWSGNGFKYKKTSLQPYIDKYGWDNIQHQVLFTNQTKENALWVEDFLIKTAREDGVCINRNRSGLITKEDGYHQLYHQQHREERNKYQREYQREYREEHRDEYNTYQREHQREYREEHRDEYNAYMREYQRKLYHRKKYLKQLNELGYIPLF